MEAKEKYGDYISPENFERKNKLRQCNMKYTTFIHTFFSVKFLNGSNIMTKNS